MTMTRANMNMQMKNQMKKKKKKNPMDKMKGIYGAAGGGSLKMVTNDQGQKVPFFAADGKGKMMAGGKVKKYTGGGKVRGCGMAKKGTRPVKMVTMAGS